MSAEVVQVHVLVKKQTINSWKRHGLYDLVLSYEIEHVVENKMGNEIWSIYNEKYFEKLTFST